MSREKSLCASSVNYVLLTTASKVPEVVQKKQKKDLTTFSDNDIGKQSN